MQLTSSHFQTLHLTSPSPRPEIKRDELAPHPKTLVAPTDINTNMPTGLQQARMVELVRQGLVVTWAEYERRDPIAHPGGRLRSPSCL